MTASPLSVSTLEPLLVDLSLPPSSVTSVELARTCASGSVVAAVYGPLTDLGDAEKVRAHGQNALASDGWALVCLEGTPTRERLAQWRNALWPWLHVVALYRCSPEGVKRETLQGSTRLEATSARELTVLVGQRREWVLSPRATVSKFDANASGWNGEPGQSGYAHFRWMRKYVAHFGSPARGERVLDFGCGAGWVGIEAALAAGSAPLAFFDPSPEMVRIAENNARASGLAELVGRTGFGEAPPFDERFEHVLSSGVVSFSPDHSAWFDGLARCVKAGGKLVIGDLNPDSRGMLHRRATRALLPAREMNAVSAAFARSELERRGFVHRATAGYQRTRPIPQLAHWSDHKLGGLLSPLLLAYNRRCAGPTDDLGAFDSWVMSFRAP